MDKKFTFRLNVKGKTVPASRAWQLGIGNDHAFQVLRTDVCSHLKRAHDEIGFRYVRFHGIFNDDMRILQSFSDLAGFNALPDAEKIGERSFRRVAVVLDNVLSCGLKPFVELSFAPKALAGSDQKGLAYGANVGMPKDLAAWAEFIRAFVRFALDRYGKEEVESWYFEVWNEPDLSLFFGGDMEDYFRLYEATARAVKEVDPVLRVGGPATSACKWLKEFRSFCTKNDVPLDFLSTHHYPGDAFGNLLSSRPAGTMSKIAKRCAEEGTPLGEAMTALFFDPEESAQWTKGAFRRMDEEARAVAGELPLFLTEWNSTSVFGAPVHDEKYSAAFVVKSVMDAGDVAEGYMFWCCSDVFEEMFDLGRPFHGAFGIVSSDGIPKPNFRAFELLSRLAPMRYELPVTDEEVELSAFTDGKKVQLLLYAQDFDHRKDETFEAEIFLNGVFARAEQLVIDDTHCNPKAEWEKLGKPDLLTPAQAETIRQKTALSWEDCPIRIADGGTAVKVSLRTNDVVLIELN